MTPEQQTIVRESYAALGSDATEMAHDFYRRLFAADPTARQLFGEGPDVMALKFAAELGALVEAISAFPGFAARVAHLGATHAGYGVRARHYQVAREALIGALAGRLAGQWNAEVEAAWRRAYNLVAELMMAVPAPPPPAP